MIKQRTLAWTAWGLLAAVLAGALSVYSFNQGRRQSDSAQNIVSGIQMDGSSAPDEYEYILRAQDGRLVVFVKGKSEPEMTFDVPVRALPEYDQRQLEQGIYVPDYQTLVSLIEDYIS